ncbi:primase-helicase family protein [Phyllobacterium sp. P5_D12]
MTDKIISREEVERRRKEKKARGKYEWPSDKTVRLEDFHAYMPLHKYFHVPTRTLWPSTSVNARIPPVLMTPEVNDPQEHQFVQPTEWLDRNRPVEQMTWMPGYPVIIENRIVAEGGFILHAGARIFNLYRAPELKCGEASQASPWLRHLRTVYPDDADHILQWLAHRVQKPGEKINHALLLGGAPGIGKDTILEPVAYAVGHWNFEEINPTQLLGRFNSFMKCVILRINEAHDLGDLSAYSFYEHCKPIMATPPETIRIDEKGINEYRIPNVAGVIITSNYKTDGVYLPPDDRRHYVAWSNLPAVGESGAFDQAYFDKLYKWYEAGGIWHVAALLQSLSLKGFDAKAPPKKTRAFYEIVDAQRSSDESEFEDAIDRLTESNGGELRLAFSTDRLALAASEHLAAWIRDPKNRRQVPKKLEKLGYIRVEHPDNQSRLWKINGRRQAVYGLRGVSERTRLDAANELYERGET